jgi:integrase/recombinase XerD
MLIGPSRVRGPLAPFAQGFVCELKRQGYRRRAVCSQLQLLVQLSRWLAGKGLGAEQVCPSEGHRFVRAHRDSGCRYPRSMKALRPILAYLRDLGAMPPQSPAPPLAMGR